MLILLLVVVVIVVLLAGPLVVAAILGAKGRTRAGAMTLSVYPLVFLILLGWALIDGSSVPGRALRMFMGEPLGKQLFSDTIERIREDEELKKLQPWAVALLERYKERQLGTNDLDLMESGLYYAAVRVPPEEQPEFVRKLSRKKNARIHLILPVIIEEEELNGSFTYREVIPTNAAPQCVAIVFGSLFRCDDGLLVGPPDYVYRTNVWMSYYQIRTQEAKPGIYVFTACNP